MHHGLPQFEESLVQQAEAKRQSLNQQNQVAGQGTDCICFLCGRNGHSRIGLLRHTLDAVPSPPYRARYHSVSRLKDAYNKLYAEPEVGSLIPRLGLQGEKPACVALGKLPSPRMPPEEGNGQPLLSIFYLENPEKDNQRSELTARDYFFLLERPQGGLPFILNVFQKARHWE